MSNHRLLPCPCAREWLAAMIEEGVRRRPADKGAEWLLWWLMDESNLPRVRARGILSELEKVKS